MILKMSALSIMHTVHLHFSAHIEFVALAVLGAQLGETMRAPFRITTFPAK